MSISPNDHTCVILAYKDNAHLLDCLISLLDQSVKTKVVISTSTPSDFIKKVAKDNNVELFINDKSEGIASDWNFATDIVTTKYYTLCHQDDIYNKNYLKYMLEKVDKDTIIAHSKGSYLYSKKERKYTINLIIKNVLNFPFIFSNRNIHLRRFVLGIGDSICCPTVLFNKEYCHNQFNNEFKQDVDWDCWERLSKLEGKFIYVPRYLVKHRITNSSTTAQNIQTSTRSNEDYLIYSRFWPKPIANFLTKAFKYSEKDNYDKQ